MLNLQNETLDERRGLTPRRHGSGMTDGKNASRGVPPPPQTAGADARAGKSPTKAKGAGSTATGTDADGAPKRRHENWGARSVECYEKLEQVGEGTYGQVRAKQCATGAREAKQTRGVGLQDRDETDVDTNAHHRAQPEPRD